MKVDIKDKIAPTNMSGWFMYLNNLTTENFQHIENIDTSECTNINYLFNYDSGFTSLDLNAWKFPKLQNASSVFSRCRGLTSLDISEWELPDVRQITGMFSECVKLESIDISNFKPQRLTYLGGLFSSCTNLKQVDLFEFTANGDAQLYSVFENCSSLEEVDLNGWIVQRPGKFQSMFKGCTSLKSVDFGPADHWGTTTSNWSYNTRLEKAYESMFEGCSSLETLDLTCVKGALICGSMFEGCTGLKEVNLEYAGKGRENRKGYDSKIPVEPDLTGKENIFEDCNKLAWIKLSAEGWPADGKAGSSVPPKAAWRKIDEPNKDLKLPSEELFQRFTADYAGTWVADSFISLKGNGGSPKIQTIEGNKDVALVFDKMKSPRQETAMNLTAGIRSLTAARRYTAATLPHNGATTPTGKRTSTISSSTETAERCLRAFRWTAPSYQRTGSPSPSATSIIRSLLP